MNHPIRRRLELDGVSGASFLGDELGLRRFIESMADIAGMKILSLISRVIPIDPEKQRGDEFQDDGGISVQALISTSHISIHTWPARHFFMFDLVSCKPFDYSKVRSAVCEALQVVMADHESYKDCGAKEPPHHSFTF